LRLRRQVFIDRCVLALDDVDLTAEDAFIGSTRLSGESGFGAVAASAGRAR